MAMRNSRFRWMLVVVGVALSIAVAFVVVYRAFGARHAETFVVLSGLTAAIVGIKPPSKPGATNREQLESARRELARRVLSDWNAEIRVRSLNDPEPLVVRWEKTQRPGIMDRESNIVRDRELCFSGQTNEVSSLNIIQKSAGVVDRARRV
jgi:hypothetical protein